MQLYREVKLEFQLQMAILEFRSNFIYFIIIVFKGKWIFNWNIGTDVWVARQIEL